jgi:probable F420-dependent oxidoreductase
VKVRIGYGLGTGGMTGEAERFGPFVDALEAHGFDSLWLSERITGPAPDPLAAIAFAAGRTRKLKFGTSVLVLPGRNPALLAKEIASIDVLSGGRMLPAVGLGVADPREQAAFGVAREDRARLFDSMLPMLRAWWAGEEVDGIRVLPQPVQQPLDVWLGGRAPSELRRVGRMGDGWLPSFCTPDDVVAGRKLVEEAAEAAGRTMDPEHWGALVAYGAGELPPRIVEALSRRRPDLSDVREIVPASLPDVRRRLEDFCAVGFSKFVLVPVVEPESWADELAAVAAEVLPLQV